MIDRGQRSDEAAVARDATIGLLLGPSHHLFVSPHYDDIALSCGGTVALLSRYRRSTRVAVVFGEPPPDSMNLTSFATATHAAWGLDVGEVAAVRRREETEAAGLLGAGLVTLPFHDAIYRGNRYVDDETLFGQPTADERDMPMAVAAALPLDADRVEETRLYAPLGIGGHVDHQIAFLAGVSLARQGWEVWFYEDMPYALREEAREALLRDVTEPLRVTAEVDISGTWQTKMAAIMCYPSQLATVFRRAGSGGEREEIDALLRDYARRGGTPWPVERFWRVDPNHTSPPVE